MTSSIQRTWMLVAMFAAGLLTGAAITSGLAWRFLPPPGMPSGTRIVEHIRRTLRSELHLTPAQESALAPVLERHAGELDAIGRETTQKIYQSIQATNLAVRQVLTPPQQQVFDRKESERMRRFPDQMRVNANLK